MIILPYGHEKPSVGGLPWVTVCLFVLCIVLFGITLVPSKRADERWMEAFEEVAEAFRMQPTLEVEPALEDMLFLYFGVDENQREVFVETLVRDNQEARHFGYGQAVSQADFDALVDRYLAEYRSSPHYRLGVVPRNISIFSLLTYQFMHGGVMHLLGNLLFLYLCGPRIEDRWGRWLFAGFYLAAGIVAALFWALRYPGLDTPLVGASGSIAGLMGAFLVCYGASKIKFFYWAGIFWGTFSVPAWLMLPLWFVIEVISGRSMDVMFQGQGGGGVAHWAHVWGFIFGMAVAAVVGRLGIDRRLGTDDDDESAADSRAVVDALEVARSGRVDEAVATLRQILSDNPDNVDAALALWQVCTDHSRASEGAPALLGVVRRAARARDDDSVIENWGKLVAGSPRTTIEPVLALRIVEILDKHRSDELLVDTFGRVDATMIDHAPPGVMARLATLAVNHRSGAAERLLAKALASGELSSDTRSRLETMASTLASNTEVPPTPPSVEVAGGPESAPVGGTPPAVELRPAERLKVAEGVPRSLDDAALTLDLDRGRCRLALGNVRAVAVGAVKADRKRPFLVVDLLLDEPHDGSADLRLVRLRSTSFDPRSLVGGDNAMAAFTELLRFLVSSSGGTPLPDAAAMANPATRSYRSIAEYQQVVLGVMG
jgi:membrane associated rhomboid family serine protease